MAKKLITVLLSLTIIACSSISIYATDINESENTDTDIIASEQTGDDDDAADIEGGANPSEDAVVDETVKDDDDAAEEEAKEEVKETAKKETKTKAQIEAEKKAAKYKKGLAAYIRYINPNVSKTKSLTMAGYFIAKAEKYNLDAKVLMAIAQNESTFYTNAKSPYGYKGLMQTSDALARRYGYKPSSLYKAEVSIEVGARYLRAMKKQFKTYTKAISAYAYGSGAVKSGNYSTAIANKILKTRKQITSYLEKRNYI
ncbi:MAG: transglycosylase SLT domain-containing protein [Emergencia sp.]